MQLKGEYKYRSAVIMDTQTMQELNELLQNYSKKIEYSCTLIDKTIITFNSIDELLSFDNDKTRRIRELHIRCGYDINVYMKPWSSHLSVFITYILSDFNEKVKFTSLLDNIFNKCKSKYNIFSKLIPFVSVLICCPFNIPIMTMLYKTYNIRGAEYYILCGAISLISCFLITIALNKLFPSLVFYWGKEIERNIRLRNIKSNIFWVVIVSTIISLFVTMVTK